MNEFSGLLSQEVSQEVPQLNYLKVKMTELKVCFLFLPFVRMLSSLCICKLFLFNLFFLQEEQKKLETEILSLDKYDDKYNANEDDDVEGDEAASMQQQEHVLYQAKINKEILVI